jgi:hypothetical protein
MLYLLKEKSRVYHFLKSRCKQNKECRKTFAPPGIAISSTLRQQIRENEF